MDTRALEFGVWMGILAVVLAAGAYGILFLRKWFIDDEDLDEEDTDEAPLYTTAEVDRLKAENQIDEAQYQKLKARALEEAKQRAERAHRRRVRKKPRLFG